jgi:GNAT superfamily N-acetyltransferase
MISLAQTDEEIKNCYAVMAELRPRVSPDEFLSQVKRQIEFAGYQLAFLTDEEVKAVAGFRISEWLAGGNYLEIEDLVSKTDERSKGYGGQLFDWLIERAEENDCDQIRLVSCVTRFGAHRFYLRKRMNIEAHYFSMNLK